LDTTRCVDSWANLEDNVTHGEFLVLFLDVADVNDAFQPNAGAVVQLLESVVGQDAVFSTDGYNIGGNAHCNQVEQRLEVLVKIDVVVLGKGLHELKAHTTTRELVVGIGVVGALGIEHSNSIRQGVVRYVVITNDEVNAFGLGVLDFLNGFDAAVQGNDQGVSVFVGIIHACV